MSEEFVLFPIFDDLHDVVLLQRLILDEILVDGLGEKVARGKNGIEIFVYQWEQCLSFTCQVELDEDGVYLVVINATLVLIRNIVVTTDSTTSEEPADVGEIQPCSLESAPFKGLGDTLAC